MTTDRPVVLVVGAAARDMTGLDPRGWRLGGAVMYASLLLSRLGLDVRALVGVDAVAARARELDLLGAAGAVVTLAALDSSPVFENIETEGSRRQRCLATSDSIPLSALPRAWTSGHDALVLAPVAGELDDAWALLAGGHDDPTVAVGWQGLLRALRAGADVARLPPSASALLRAAALVVASREDFAPGTSYEHLMPLLGPATTLVVTAAEEGGEILARDPTPAAGAVLARTSTYPAIPSDRTVDPTGAGDVFLAGMLAAMIAPELAPGPDGPTRFAAAAASLSVEAPGLSGVPDLDAVRRRMTRAPSLASRRPSATSSRTSGRPSQA